MRRKIHGYHYSYVIAGKVTRGGSLIADSRKDAEQTISATLADDEYIYSLTLDYAV